MVLADINEEGDRASCFTRQLHSVLDGHRGLRNSGSTCYANKALKLLQIKMFCLSSMNLDTSEPAQAVLPAHYSKDIVERERGGRQFLTNT